MQIVHSVLGIRHSVGLSLYKVYFIVDRQCYNHTINILSIHSIKGVILWLQWIIDLGADDFVAEFSHFAVREETGEMSELLDSGRDAIWPVAIDWRTATRVFVDRFGLLCWESRFCAQRSVRGWTQLREW